MVGGDGPGQVGPGPGRPQGAPSGTGGGVEIRREVRVARLIAHPARTPRRCAGQTACSTCPPYTSGSSGWNASASRLKLLEPGIGVMLAVLGVTGNLDGDDVLGDVVTPVGAECGAEYPGADEGASRLVLAPARQLPLGEQPLVLRGLLGTDVDDDDDDSLMTTAPLVALAPILAPGPARVNPRRATRCHQPMHEIRLICVVAEARQRRPGRAQSWVICACRTAVQRSHMPMPPRGWTVRDGPS